MKKLLTVLGSLMIGTSSAALVVACNNTNPSQPANKDKDENPSNSGGSEKPGKTDEDKKPTEDKKPGEEKKPDGESTTPSESDPKKPGQPVTPSPKPDDKDRNGTKPGETTPPAPVKPVSNNNSYSVYYDSATGHDIDRNYSDKRDAEEETHRKHHAESSSKITELLFDDTIAEATYKYDLEKRKKESAEFSEAVIRNSDTVNGRANWSGVTDEGRRAAEEASDWVTRNSDAINK
ncbi:Vmc-like lipoprotein signal peptide domain-containing protein [Mycoplasma mycoides]|uniref:Vmc-like lipoprotein signal peptide domain-containing protein n=1 Tax=Mycoplasma mycoides TaxID=2102 RepID=UPI002240858E|nr:lipoprotein [Mycoplasma mycoides]QVJ95448.1 lipoprotein [Mycoplasma mycoides subsp. capri]